jgi:hypothetical protein
MPAIWI